MLDSAKQEPMVSRFKRVIKQDGSIYIGGVASDSPVSKFLDKIVDPYSRGGHKGNSLKRPWV